MRTYETVFFADGPIKLHDRTNSEGAPSIRIGAADGFWHTAPILIHVPENLRDAYSRACAAFNAVMAEEADEQIETLQAAE